MCVWLYGHNESNFLVYFWGNYFCYPVFLCACARFPRSEGERINALVEAKCAGYVCEAADDILRKLQNGQFPSDIQEIR